MNHKDLLDIVIAVHVALYLQNGLTWKSIIRSWAFVGISRFLTLFYMHGANLCLFKSIPWVFATMQCLL
jgi:hypothetical protein